MIMPRIITITLSPTLDRTLWVDALVPGGLNRVVRERVDSGGKGINVAKVLARFGIKALAAAFTGKDNSDEFRRILKEEISDFLLVPVSGSVRENTLIIPPDGSMYKLDKAGTPLPEGAIPRLESLLEGRINSDSIVVFAGRLPPGTDKAVLSALLCRFKEQGAKLIVDSQSFDIDDLHTLRPYLIKPNSDELKALVDGIEGTADDEIKAARYLCDIGVEHVLVSRGRDGLMLVDRENVIIATVPDVPVLSTVGAGDSALAGYLMAMVSGKNKEECVKSAAAMGTGSCMSEGTAGCDRVKYETVREHVTVTRGC